MKHEALTELRNIIKLPTVGEVKDLKERLLEDWIERWIVDVEFSQSVTDSKYLTSEYDDLIKTKLASGMAEDLAESCVHYQTQKKKITGTMLAFRRKAKT